MERRILDFLAFAEALKRELRHSWLSNGRQESVAEHSWQMGLLALLAHRHLEHPVDLDRALRMILIHDLAEAECGDQPYFAVTDRAAKTERERAAMEKIRAMLDPATGDEIVSLWAEYEAGETPEAKFCRALNALEVQIQHNLASRDTWEPVEYELVHTKMDGPCEHDRFLSALCAAVKKQALQKSAPTP